MQLLTLDDNNFCCQAGTPILVAMQLMHDDKYYFILITLSVNGPEKLLTFIRVLMFRICIRQSVIDYETKEGGMSYVWNFLSMGNSLSFFERFPCFRFTGSQENYLLQSDQRFVADNGVFVSGGVEYGNLITSYVLIMITLKNSRPFITLTIAIQKHLEGTQSHRY